MTHLTCKGYLSTIDPDLDTGMPFGKLANPARWGSRPVRNCQPVGPVTLNPEKRDRDKTGCLRQK